MPNPFSPPGLKILAEVDRAEGVRYGDQFIDVEGVVSPSGQGGWPGRNEGYKVHSFTFAAWRRLGQHIIGRDLTILRPVPPKAEYFKDFPTYSIQRIRILLSSDETRAIFERSLPAGAFDPNLRNIADDLKKPVVVSTERFGELVLDRRINWFEGQADWSGERIRVSFPADQGTVPRDSLNAAERLWADQATWKKRIDDYAVQELLELKNDVWLAEGESKITGEEFVSRMELQSISVSPNGDFEFWHNDDDLFRGHAIDVRGNVNDGPTDAGISG